MNILVPNLGSTSLKYRIVAMPSEEVLTKGHFERVSDYDEVISKVALGEVKVDAVAFKAVHAGPKYQGTFVVDDAVMAAQEEFLGAAPAHNAIYLTGMRAFARALPGVPLVAAFETEYHATMPEYAVRYGVPSDWHDRFGVRRYGFHGASHRFIAERVAELLGVPAEGLRLVSCHLGGSSSMCAVKDGRSIDTSMGFSPQSGLENAARHGDLDVFAVLYVMERNGWTIDEVRRQLSRVSGLAGLSNVPGGDVRDIEKAIAGGSAAARLALDVFVYEIRKYIGAYAVAMGGLDAIAFTGGIGENSPRLRAECCAGLGFLGVELDAAANGNGSGDRLLSAPGSRVKVLAVAANEEIIVARRAYACLQARLTTVG
ncbi:MAG: acetate/propionate family kinase [Bryobacterales bacterium]|nr:acetate/propionate family kinase [Bryobacterales bacterium]